MSAREDNLAAWQQEIQQILDQVAYVREVLAAGGTPEPPRWEQYRLGRLPLELCEQAQRAASELQAVQEEIKAAMERNRVERDRLHIAPQKKPDALPRYLDVEG